MAISPERNIKLNLKQVVAVASTRYLQGKKGELMVSQLSQIPTGLTRGETAFEYDSLGGVQKIYREERNKWYEIFLFGPINNKHRNLIAQYFGLSKNSEIRSVTDKIGQFNFEREYLVTTKRKEVFKMLTGKELANTRESVVQVLKPDVQPNGSVIVRAGNDAEVREAILNGLPFTQETAYGLQSNKNGTVTAVARDNSEIAAAILSGRPYSLPGPRRTGLKR